MTEAPRSTTTTANPLGDLATSAKDALYVGLGAAVLGFQKLQVQRQELLKQARPALGDARDQFERIADTVTETVEEQVKVLENRLDAVEDQVDVLLDRLQDELPEQAAELVGQIRDAARDARTQVRTLVNRAA